MFSDLLVLNFLIYAAGIGFAVAIIFTNIQRTAYSKFISFLANNKCFDEDSSATFSEIGLSPLQTRIIRSAIKNQHGFRRSIAYVNQKSDNQAKGDEFFSEKQDTTKYYICDGNVDELLKKYSYKTMPAKLVILFIAALFAVVIIFTSLVNMFMKSVLVPKLDNDSDDIPLTQETEEGNKINTPDENKTETEENNDISQDDENADDSAAGPRIPV